MIYGQVVGHLGKDPEIRFTPEPDGQKVTTFSVATKHRKGKEDITIWVRVVVWGDRFDKIISYLKKGSAVMVWGKLYLTNYTDKEGRTQTNLEVTAATIDFSPFGKTDREAQTSQPTASSQTHGGSNEMSRGSYDEGQFQMNRASAPYKATHSSYGSQTVGQNSHSEAIDEDALPF